MRVLFVYSQEPSGHASAARALEAELSRLGIQTSRVSLADDYHPALGRFIAGLYLAVIRGFPALWTFLYDNARLGSWLRHWPKLYLLFGAAKLRRTLTRLKPDLIVCTHAMPLMLLSEAKARSSAITPTLSPQGRGNIFSWALAGVVTDYQPHRYWARASVDLYLVANEGARERLTALGISPARIQATGIPIHPVFSSPLAQDEARRRIAAKPEGPVLLVSGGSRGLGPVGETAEALLLNFPEAEVLVACGRNEGLARELKAKFGGLLRLKIYSDLAPSEMKELIAAADLVIGKAGGLSASEAAALGAPMILYRPIGGQEARNADYLLSQGAARIAANIRQLIVEARNCCRPKELAALRLNAIRQSNPQSSRKAAEALAELFPSPKVPSNSASPLNIRPSSRR